MRRGEETYPLLVDTCRIIARIVDGMIVERTPANGAVVRRNSHFAFEIWKKI